MPSFVGRLSKHSNRSQPAIAEQPLSPNGPGLGLGSGGAPAAGNSGPGLLADSPAEAAPPSANTALSSSEPFVDALQNLASPPSSHLCNPQPAGSSLNPAPLPIPSLGVAAEDSSPSFNGRQRLQTPLEQQRSPPPPPLSLASQRLHPQQQQLYDIASASVDQAPGPDVLQQSQTAIVASEKRSTRKLIKGIFSSSGRTSHDPHQHKSSPSHGHHGSYDNTAGLVRRSSKRDSRITLPKTTIRSVPGEQLELSSYEDDRFQPPDHPPPQHQPQPQPQPHPLQRRGTLHVQEHQVLHESQAQQTASYDQPSLQTRSHGLPHPHLHLSGIPSQGPHEQFSEPHIVPSHSSAVLQQQNPETISQLSYDSWVTDSDQRSLHQQNSVQTSPAAVYSATLAQEAASAIPKPTPTQTPDNHSPQPPAMVPPGGVPPPNRRLDAEKALRGQAEPAPGPATGYRQGSISTNPMSPLPPTSGQNLSYRGDRASQYEGSASVDQGRDSPQPSNADQEVSIEKHKELLVKYKNVKRLYFENRFQITQLTGQVEQLQNAVANQRMSQSRTAWDDNEYSTRFNRLNGAINNLSFNIRKDWRCLPPWLDSYVSVDAVKTGKQEMTAVGRAIVSRWIVEEIFDKCFHPGLDQQLSSQLKQIELSIRGNAYMMHSQEEFDALTTKVVNWRMATLDGLQQRLNSPEMSENRAMLISKATKNLTAYLYQHLNNPPPSGVEGSTSMIAELAVAIATNLPIESRDVAIMYPLPGDAVQTHLMEIEKTGLPTLDSHKSEIEVVAEEGGGEVEDEADKDMEKGPRARGEKTKTGFPKDAGKVRFAGFMALEVRGRQVLMKAPVWTV